MGKVLGAIHLRLCDSERVQQASRYPHLWFGRRAGHLEVLLIEGVAEGRGR